jgi:DNA gyrase subunit A
MSFAKETIAVSIESELKQSYLAYAMSVIVGRALPDARDGLKPVHRRVLYAMHELGNDWNKAYKKSARIVGDVIGKYHPHGDTAVYDTMVRMAQPFSMRYMLIDGQGNFGSVDGDSPAAMRYTEVRMSRLAHSLLADLEKETVDFAPNYDETEFAPVVMPTRVPNLLVNGSSGIAVGMATNIPPHNLGEVIDASVALLENPALTIDELCQFVPGPDFPTAAIINGRAGIIEAYRTGRGRAIMRARTEIETEAGSEKQKIIVTELPYQVNKAKLIEKIAELVKEKLIDGITGLRDESDKDGMRIVIELRRGELPDIVINKLYTQTQLQNVFSINMVALVDNQPRILNLKDLLAEFLKHRREVVTRRSIFELRKARDRAHILEGLSIALSNIDEVIAMIKAAKTPAEAKESLIARAWQPGQVLDLLERSGSDVCRPETLEPQYGFVNANYHLSPTQAQAILDLRLHRLTGLEQSNITKEYQEVIEQIAALLLILGSDERLKEVIKQELLEVRAQFADPRRSEIVASQQDLTTEDLITPEDVVVTISHEGYAKAQSLETYQSQRRGGRGKASSTMKEEDFIDQLLVANTHDTLLCFSSLGQVYWLKTYQLPMANRTARGKPLVNLLPLTEGEKINAVLPIREFSEDKFVFMATSQGTVKKVSLEQFSRPRANGIRAIELRDNDRLVGVDITDGSMDVMLFSDTGKVIRFQESDVRATGRIASGVRGIRLQAGQEMIALQVVHGDGAILTATEGGYGKRTAVDEYRQTGRGGQGVISIQTTERNGKVVSATQVLDTDDVILITDKGTLVRIPVDQISIVGRNTQGVRLINLSDGEQLQGLQRVQELLGVEGVSDDEDSGVKGEEVNDDAS